MNTFDLWDFTDPGASLERFRHVVDNAAVDMDKAFALTQVARALGMQGHFVEARAALAEADQLLPASGRERAQYWIELGRIDNGEHNPGEALSCFRKSLALATHAQDEYLRVDAAHMIAIVVPKEAQPESGEFALSLALAMGGSIGFIEEELAECLFSLGKTVQAKPLFQAAYNKLKANTRLGEREPERLSRLLERSL